jgi:hypothetical protein
LIDVSGQKKSRRLGACAGFEAGAAFLADVFQDLVHGLVVGGADHLAAATLLIDQARLRKGAQMVAKSCCGDAEHAL